MQDITTLTLPIPPDTLAIFALVALLAMGCYIAFLMMPPDPAKKPLSPRERLEEFIGLKTRSEFVAALLFVVLFLYFIIFFAALIIATRAFGAMLFAPLAEVMAPPQPRTSLAFGALLAAILGAPFIIWRTFIAAKQTLVAEESLFNDKINTAATDLAARRMVTRVIGRGAKTQVLSEEQDDLVTRAAAIDRLEGLAEEAMKRGDFAPAQRIARMLSIYVQELSRDPAHAAKPAPKFESRTQMQAWARTLRPIQRTDMERAVQSLGRLNRDDAIDRETFDPKNIDLRRCNLQGFDLRDLNFRGIQLEEAQMQGADLFEAQMQGAILFRAQLQGANLRWAQMQGAILFRAQMQGANLEWALLQGADLEGAQMQGVILEWAQLQGADLEGALLQGAYLSGTLLQGAYLSGTQMSEDTDLNAATLRGAAFRSVDDTTLAQLQAHDDWDQMFHPDDLTDFTENWRAFAAALDPPVTIAPDFNRTD